MRLSIGAKLAVGFTIILLIGGWMGWRTYQMYSDLQTRYTQLLQETYPLALAAQRLNVQVQTQAQMLMAYAVTREERAKTAVGEARQRAQEEMEFLQAAADRHATLSEQVAAIMDKQQTFNTMVTALFKTGDEVNAMMLQQDADRARSVAQRMSQDVDTLVADLQAEVEFKRAETLAEAEAALRTLAILAAVALAICILVVCLVQVFIAQPVRRVARELQGIAGGAGDLTRRLRIRTGDELQDLADSFNQMQARLADMVRRVVAAAAQIAARSQEAQSGTRSVSQATAHVGDAMGQVAAGAQNQAVSATTAAETMQQLMEAIGQIAAGAQQQAVQVQGTTVTGGNMVRAMEGVARHSEQVTEAADLAAETARRGADIVDQTLAGMQRIRDKVLAAANRMENLDQHTRRIGEIMKVITDIADQTNLLALNAAIEAARAGEQGRGFAVVADEVRKLAERAAHSAKEIRVLIKNIQSGMSEAVAATREGVKGVESGSELAAAAGAALQEIRTTVERTTSGIQRISRAAQEVLGATQEVARSVEEVAAVTEENSAATEQMAAGASQVNEIISDVQRVCESNSRAVEEVSASLQEVNSSMAAIAQLSDEMARVAATLQELVGQFCVDDVEGDAEGEMGANRVPDRAPDREPEEDEEAGAAGPKARLT